MQRLQEQPRPDAPLEVGEPTLLALVSRPAEQVEASAADVIRELARAKPLGDEKAALAEALLALLSKKAFGHVVVKDRTLRHEVTEAVLRLGYPWALQLEPGDVAALQPREPSRRWRLGLIAAALVVAALAAAASLGGVAFIGGTKPPSGQVAPFRRPAQAELPKTTIPPPTAEAVASRVAELRRDLLTGEARALAEGCVVAFEEPKPCVEEVIRLLPETADPEHDRYLRRQWVMLSNEPGAVVRARARTLFVNEFAREAALFPPPSPEEAQLLMFFIERSVSLSQEAQGWSLGENASNCVSRPGQVGAICRAFLARARALKAAPP